MKLLIILAMMTWLFVTVTLSQKDNILNNLPDEPFSFCGDGVCSDLETALPTSVHRCFDCGRLRGVIGLAVGQKDQLPNITVSVWADPVNPALFLRNGTQVPPADFIAHSDAKGFFSINTLSFDAQGSNQTQGQSTRRFYFSLTGQYVDRISGAVQELLPLWWNYELTNSQWSGVGDLTGTNNSPSLYFYMTPPFSTAEALLRVILSWGAQISNPSTALPDLDLVVAGPVDQSSIDTFGSGIVNFQNKNQHTSTNTILPYATLLADSAQGFGPEVMDFYGINSSSPSLGFSDTYTLGAPANAYEIWVDRPNSLANADSAFTFIYDTNAFLIVYQNDGSIDGNKQLLFDLATNVPYTYGFRNKDQWNNIPSTATLWHVFDISQLAQGIVYNGFPGENTTDYTSPGAKYGYDAPYFESTKTLPCGHVDSRGANPAYCPFQLTYPQEL